MDSKIPLPAFIQTLTSHNVPASKAMAVAGKIYKTYNTPSLLSQLSDAKLKSAGVDDKDTRKLVLAAIRKAGYKPSAQRANSGASGTSSALQSTLGGAGTSSPSNTSQAERPRKKRKRDDDLNEFLPDRPPDEGDQYGSLEFNEVLDEQILKQKYTVVNRAPIMMAWAFVVAERLGFQREEALSIASVYTEMNAITKGVSLGIFDEDKKKGVEASPSGSQPYVDLMGRRPLYQTASGGWRALSSGAPVAPTSAFSYISRALRQTTPHVLGALRLLAASYAPADLNRLGFSLYADFRPSVEGWGGRGEVRCATILELRRAAVKMEDSAERRISDGAGNVEALVKIEHTDGDSAGGEEAVAAAVPEEPANKKPHTMTVEEYEAALDEDHTFDDIDLNFDNVP